MNMVTVNSAIIRAAGYDEPTEILRLELTTGKVYEYQNVPLRTYQLLMRSPSKGEYFNTNIRDTYAYSEVTPVS